MMAVTHPSTSDLADAGSRAVIDGATARLQKAGAILGSGKCFRRRLTTPMDLHRAMVEGVFPYASLDRLLSHCKHLKAADIAPAVGLTDRALRDRLKRPDASMPAAVASRAWLVAEVLVQAAGIFGGLEQAEHWMTRPATGLDGLRPIELVETLQGAGLLKDFLGRLEYGVYS